MECFIPTYLPTYLGLPFSFIRETFYLMERNKEYKLGILFLVTRGWEGGDIK